MQLYAESLTEYRRLKTLEVRIGDLLLGNGHPIRVQTMTTTDTMDTAATVAQTIRCIEAGAEMVRITAPSRKEAENLRNIRDALRKQGYRTPLIADIHFTPNAAEIAARIVEKVRVNPGNYIDKKKFEFIEYTDADYREEIDRIRERFTPLVRICREHGTAMRIGTNHGSLSDRIMSRYGDTPVGMVESAMEFLRIARDENYHNIVLSMKSSNPQVMVQAYRLLVQTMDKEFSARYPLHLGVTEAGDGEDGRIKSAIGIGTLLEDGIGDTIRVSLTEDPEFEIPVCLDLAERYRQREAVRISAQQNPIPVPEKWYYDPFAYRRRESQPIGNTGGKQVPVVVADLSHQTEINPGSLRALGYQYDSHTDKWQIGDGAADFIYVGKHEINFALPGTLQVIYAGSCWREDAANAAGIPLFSFADYRDVSIPREQEHGLLVDAADTSSWQEIAQIATAKPRILLVVHSTHPHAMPSVRSFVQYLSHHGVKNPLVLRVSAAEARIDQQLIHFATDAGALLLDGIGDGIWLDNQGHPVQSLRISGRTYLDVHSNEQFLNNTAFSILQATRTRISKTEYISCPSCGRTLFDLQETTAKIRAVTHHLKGVKIAIMGCIVNGPGEMADADFGYVGSGPGKITLYKGKEIVRRSVDSEVAVEALIELLKTHDAWVDPPVLSS